MSLANLGKRLQREAAANPAKAAVLGVATLVAVYFWAPLLKGWIAPSNPETATTISETTTAPSAASAVSATVPTVSPEAAVIDAKPAGPSWLQIAEWMKDDPQTMTAPALTMTRDPFESPAANVVETKPAVPERPKAPVITPTAAGLVLTSTIIGPQRRIAQINGRTYAVGQVVLAGREKDESKEKEKESLKVAFKLVEVHARRVVLEANGQRFELTIPEPGKSEKIELFGTAGDNP